MVISCKLDTQYKTLQVNPKVTWKSKNVCRVNSIKRLVEKLLFLKEEFLRELALHTSNGERWLRKSPPNIPTTTFMIMLRLARSRRYPILASSICHKHFVPPSNMIPLILDDFDGEYLASYSTKNDIRKQRQFKPEPLPLHQNSRIHMLSFDMLINLIGVNN